MKKLSLLPLLLGVIALPACIITSSDDDGATSTPQPTTDPSTSGGDTGDPDATADPDDATADPDDTGEEEEDDTADETGSTASCGWGPTGDEEVPEGYVCGGDGEDPDGAFDIDCPADLVEGARCGERGELTGVGCCDADGNVWFCWDDGDSKTLVKEEC